MSNNITGGSIIWNLDVDDSKLKSGLAGAKSNVESASKSIEKDTGSAKDGVNKLGESFKSAEGASRAFAATMTVVGTALIAAAGFAIKSASDMENLRMSLDVMTGSAESGGKVFKDLYDFAAKTPFETADLAKATQTMLGFGISSKDVMANLKMLGDVSMGNNDKLQSLTLAFSQMSSTGRLMGQDLLQMINAGFNPLTIIAKKTGKSMIQLKDDMAAGEISAQMVTDAFKTATSQGGLFYQGMEKGSQTLSGTWSTLKDSVGMLARQLVGLSSTGEVIKGGLFDKLKDAIKTFSDTLAYLSTDEGLKRIEDFLNTMKIVAPIVAGAIIGGLIPAFTGWAIATWAALAPLIPFIAAGAAIGAIVLGVIAVFKNWDKIMGAIKNTLTTVSTAISGFFTSVGVWFVNLFTQIGNFFVGVGTSISNFVKSIPSVISSFMTNLGNLFLDGLKFIGSIFTYWIPYFVGYTIEMLMTLPGKIWNILTTILSNFTQAINNLWNYLSTEVPKLINSIGNWFNELPGKIWTALTTAFNNIKQWGTNTWNYLSTEVNKWITNIFNWFNELPGKISSGLSSLGSTIKNSFSNAWNTLVSEISQWPNRIWDWGKNIANSFVEGFKNALGNIGRAFTDGINSAKRSMEGHSPPKEGPLKEIDKWGTNIGNAWVSGFTNSISGISSLMNSSLSQLQGILSVGNISLDSPQQAGGNTQTVTIENVNVQDKSDIDALTRSLGFKLGTI